MKGISKSLVFVLAMLLVVQPMLSWAGGGARVIPQGTVSLLADGKEVSQFQSEMPLPEGSLMLCNGNCLVQTQNIQLVAQDRAVFALAESKARWDLTVKSGQVDFAMRTGAKPISFHTPHDTVQAEQAILPASGTAMVRGSIIVTEKESVVAVQEGALQMMSSDGTLLAQPGQSIRLVAQDTSSQKPGEKKGEDKKKEGGWFLNADGTLTTAAYVTIGVVALGVGGIAYAVASSGGDNERALSPQ